MFTLRFSRTLFLSLGCILMLAALRAALRTDRGQERRCYLQVRRAGSTLGRLDPGFLRRPGLSTELLPAPRPPHRRRRYRQGHRLLHRDRRSQARHHPQEPGRRIHPPGRLPRVEAPQAAPGGWRSDVRSLQPQRAAIHVELPHAGHQPDVHRDQRRHAIFRPARHGLSVQGLSSPTIVCSTASAPSMESATPTAAIPSAPPATCNTISSTARRATSSPAPRSASRRSSPWMPALTGRVPIADIRPTSPPTFP